MFRTLQVLFLVLGGVEIKEQKINICMLTQQIYVGSVENFKLKQIKQVLNRAICGCVPLCKSNEQFQILNMESEYWQSLKLRVDSLESNWKTNFAQLRNRKLMLLNMKL